jgi:hypothetical protein
LPTVACLVSQVSAKFAQTPSVDSYFTRRWRENADVASAIGLVFVDEVHGLSDESRGSVLEAVVTRVKFMKTNRPVRFMAASATVKNLEVHLAHSLRGSCEACGSVCRTLKSGSEAAHAARSRRPVLLRLARASDRRRCTQQYLDSTAARATSSLIAT